jgi:thioredoxin reductase (NADPH)
MMEVFRRHAQDMGVEFCEERVLNTFQSGDTWMISAGSDVFEAFSLVFTGGITRGKKYPGEEEHLGSGVSYCATCDGMIYKGKPVTVIGFGPADMKEAEFLRGIGCKVSYFEKPAKVEIPGSGIVTSVLVDGEELETACVFILRPSLAPTELFPGLELEGNYIKVDREMATNLPGLYAAGDCTGTPLQVSKAVGEGLVAGQKAMAYAVRIKKEKEN